VRSAFTDIVSESAKSTVAIECDGQRVALGTIVAAEGLVVTKASQLTGEAQCELPDGTKHAAKVLNVDDEFDLAMLQIDAQELPPIDWSSSAGSKPGSWLVTSGFKGRVTSVGVVSVAARRIVGTRAMLGVQIGPSEVEARVENVLPNSGAAEAGIQDDDVITHIMDQPVLNIGQLQAALKEYRAGDKVLAKVSRGENKLEFDVTLGAPDDMFFRFRRSRMNGPLSRRRDGFPSAIQHDSVFDPTACGGPVVDVSGKAVGINIARADRIASYAVPADDVMRIVKRLRTGADDAVE
jgi:serine protease Do